MNLGYLELGGPGASIRVYYNPTTQALTNGPRGYCLDVSNSTGETMRVIVKGLGSSPLDVVGTGQGKPVTAGNNRSRTAAEMAAAGFTTRANLGQVSVSKG